MKKKIFTMGMAAILLAAGCSKKDSTVDETPPVIDLSVAGAFPQQCSQLTRGQTITFKARFRDNTALGSYGVDIHHNFDHHSHSTEVNDCSMDEKKDPVHPLTLIKNYTIPEGSKSYDAEVSIAIPAGIDAGDYHFMISVTDNAGWQTLKGLSIKIK